MKTYMPLDGFRWSCDSDSALCDIPQTNVLGQAGGGLTFGKINPEVLFYGTSGRDFMLLGVLPDSNTSKCLISASRPIKMSFTCSISNVF